MKKCRFDCMTCPYVQTGKTVVANSSNYKHDIENQVDCQTANVIYCLSCNKCKEQYIGETEKTLSVRFRQHRGYVRNREIDKSTGEHFNKPGHTMALDRAAVFSPQMNNDVEEERRIFEGGEKEERRDDEGDGGTPKHVDGTAGGSKMFV